MKPTRYYIVEGDVVLIYTAPHPSSALAVSIERGTLAQVRKTYRMFDLKPCWKE